MNVNYGSPPRAAYRSITFKGFWAQMSITLLHVILDRGCHEEHLQVNLMTKQ